MLVLTYIFHCINDHPQVSTLLIYVTRSQIMYASRPCLSGCTSDGRAIVVVGAKRGQPIPSVRHGGVRHCSTKAGGCVICKNMQGTQRLISCAFSREMGLNNVSQSI